MIKDIRIQRFKNLEDLSLTLGNVTVLVGSNNAGKSSVLQALQFATSMSQSLKLDGKARWSNGSVSGTLAAEQLVYLPFRDIDGLAHGGSLRQAENTAIRVEMTDDSLGTVTTEVRRGKNKNLSLKIEGRNFGRQLEPLTTPFMVMSPGLAGIPAVEEFRSAGIVRRAAAKGDANSVLRNILWLLKSDNHAWEKFCRRLRHVFPRLGIGVGFDEETDEIIEAHIVNNGIQLPLDSSGTGVLQVVQILAYIGVYKPRVLLLDEPDSHLHPANQRILGTLLSQLTENSDLQVILSTHSRHLLEELRVHNATIHWIDGGKVSSEPHDHVDILLGLGALDAGDRLRNGKTPWILLTEDTDVELVKNLVVSSGIPRESLDVWSYRGCTQIGAARILASFIREHAPDTKVIVHRDRDYHTDDEISTFELSLLDDNLIPFTTLGTDVESHYLNAEFIVSHFVDYSLSTDRAQELIDEATIQARDDSLEIMTRARAEQEAHRRKTQGKSGPPNFYEITKQCTKDFDREPQKYRHGKKTLKKLKAILQNEIKTSNFTFAASKELSVAYLAERIASEGAGDPEVH